MDNILIKHGYYMVVDRDDKNFCVEFGKAYRTMYNIDKIEIKNENGFINFYISGKKMKIADEDLVDRTYSEVVDFYIEKMCETYTKNAFVKRDGDSLVPYFEKV